MYIYARIYNSLHLYTRIDSRCDPQKIINRWKMRRFKSQWPPKVKKLGRTDFLPEGEKTKKEEILDWVNSIFLRLPAPSQPFIATVYSSPPGFLAEVTNALDFISSSQQKLETWETHEITMNKCLFFDALDEKTLVD